MGIVADPWTADDEAKGGERVRECPYLRRAKDTAWYPVEGYCLAHSNGGLRVVTIAEFRELCTRSEHVRCGQYRLRCELTQPKEEPEHGGA